MNKSPEMVNEKLFKRSKFSFSELVLILSRFLNTFCKCVIYLDVFFSGVFL